MSLQDIVNSTISSSTVTPSRLGFGTPLLLCYHTAWLDRLRYYSSLAALLTDGFTVNSPAYKMAQALLSSNPTVTRFAVGRRANMPHQTLVLTVTDATQGAVYNLTTVGSDGASHAHTYQVPAAQTTTQVATAIAALLTELNIGTVSTATNTITISRTDGLLTDLKAWSSNFGLADNTADPGVAADLAAVYAADQTGWYALALDSNSKAEIQAAAAWVESTQYKIFATNNSDTENMDPASTTDVAYLLKQSAYACTYGQQAGSQLLCYSGAAILGEELPRNPGTSTWFLKTLPGVPADNFTENQQIAMKAKNWNWYTTIASINVTQNGVCPGGEYMDVTRFTHWLNSNLQIDVFSLLASLPKLPYTDGGLDQLANTITTRIKIGGSKDFGGLDLTRGYTVTVPALSQTLASDRAARTVNGITWSAFLSGAIQTVNIAGTVTV